MAGAITRLWFRPKPRATSISTKLTPSTSTPAAIRWRQRSTFADLHNSAKRWNLDYLKNLGCNYLWFQPIHPNGIDGRQIDPNTGQPFTVGSPYAVKNFFDIMELMGQSNTRSGALSEFQGFMTATDTAGVGVMLDAPFNHTSYDVELAQKGVDLIKPGAEHPPHRFAMPKRASSPMAISLISPTTTTASAPRAPRTSRRRRTAMTSENLPTLSISTSANTPRSSA